MSSDQHSAGRQMTRRRSQRDLTQNPAVVKENDAGHSIMPQLLKRVPSPSRRMALMSDKIGLVTTSSTSSIETMLEAGYDNRERKFSHSSSSSMEEPIHELVEIPKTLSQTRTIEDGKAKSTRMALLMNSHEEKVPETLKVTESKLFPTKAASKRLALMSGSPRPPPPAASLTSVATMEKMSTKTNSKRLALMSSKDVHLGENNMSSSPPVIDQSDLAEQLISDGIDLILPEDLLTKDETRPWWEGAKTLPPLGTSAPNVMQLAGTPAPKPVVSRKKLKGAKWERKAEKYKRTHHMDFPMTSVTDSKST